MNRANVYIGREEALRDDFHFDSTYDYGEDDEWAEDESQWNGEEEVTEEEATEAKDESQAYLEFLNDEVRIPEFLCNTLNPKLILAQAQKFSRVIGDGDDEDDLGEDSVLLESPLDKIEPYQLFKATLMSKWPAPARIDDGLIN